MSKITAIRAMEVLDSRGTPTIQVEVTAENFSARAAVPSGASTGVHEAVELRDGDKARFGGKGVLTAVANVTEKIAPKLIGMEVTDQKNIDKIMLELDGTDNKAVLGANAILGVSLACARVGALSKNQTLVEYLRQTYAVSAPQALPIPMLNVINGGAHADSGLDIQEYMLVPQGIASFKEQLRASSEIFQALKKILKEQGFRVAVGDEGGFAPALKKNEDAFAVLVQAITAAGYVPGKDVFLAIDSAASGFYENDKYQFEGQARSSEELNAIYQSWLEKYPIMSIEDGLAEDDWSGWQAQTAAMGEKIMTVGDDLYTTNIVRVKQGIEQKASNAILIKLNQIGSLTETMECIALAQANNLKVVVSHRSGETTDSFIADLAVASGAGFIKTGAPNRSERLAKYNRLLEIEAGW